jgi:serine/threonine protein kinase
MQPPLPGRGHKILFQAHLFVSVMMLPPEVSETVNSSKNCAVTRSCSPNDVSMDSHHHVPIFVIEMHPELPNPMICGRWSSKLFPEKLHGQGSHRVLEQVLLAGAELQRSTVEEKRDGSIEPVDKVPKSWIPKSRSEHILRKPSSWLRSFTSKKNTEAHSSNNHSSHPRLQDACQSTGFTKEERLAPNSAPNSYHSRKLTELIHANSGNKSLSVASVHQMLQADDGTLVSGTADVALIRQDDEVTHPSDHRKFSSSFSSYNEGDLDIENENNELYIGPNPLKTVRYSLAMVESLGDTPLSDEVAYIEECLSTHVSVTDRKKWDGIPQFRKMDLVVGKHLGKGSFSDAFEVVATVVNEETSTLESLGADRADLDKLMEAKFPAKDGDVPETCIGSTGGAPGMNFHVSDLDDPCNKDEEGDRDEHIDALFSSKIPNGAQRVIHKDNSDQPIQDTVNASSAEFRPDRVQPRPMSRRASDHGSSVCLGSLSRPSQKHKERKVILAMKCLRPQIRSNAVQFQVGIEDLVHETAILASLDHTNIVKIHGRADGRDSNSFLLGDGFFILLDKLTETLEERIRSWKNLSYGKAAPSLSQVNAACSIADAMSYLHSKRIVFRDLKPANVGFDSTGVLKLFDFGFAVCMDDSPRCQSMCNDEPWDYKKSSLLYDRCGTPRYMAPEVGLELGYSLPADVYTFGILLWEICALKKPFSGAKSPDEIHQTVFLKNVRPKLYKHWPRVLRDLMTSCWSSSAEERPAMWYAKTMLSAHAREASMPQNNGKGNLRGSLVFRRLTWDL